MEQRNLQVIKWEGRIPAVAICTFCNSEFRVMPQELIRASDSEAWLWLREQFERHSCDCKTSHTTGRVFYPIDPALTTKKSLATKGEHWDVIIQHPKEQLKTVHRQCDPLAQLKNEEWN